MKKINVCILMAFLVASLNMSAGNYFFGGGLNLSSDGFSNTTGTQTSSGKSTFTYMVAPVIGISLNDKITLGLSLTFQDSLITLPTTISKSVSNTRWCGVNPYLIYTFKKMGNLCFCGEAFLNYQMGANQLTEESVTTNGPIYSRFGIGVRPNISYDLSDKFTLIAKMGEVSYFFKRTSMTMEAVATTTTTVQPTFNCGIDFSHVSFVAIYKF